MRFMISFPMPNDKKNTKKKHVMLVNMYGEVYYYTNNK